MVHITINPNNTFLDYLISKELDDGVTLKQPTFEQRRIISEIENKIFEKIGDNSIGNALELGLITDEIKKINNIALGYNPIVSSNDIPYKNNIVDYLQNKIEFEKSLKYQQAPFTPTHALTGKSYSNYKS